MKKNESEFLKSEAAQDVEDAFKGTRDIQPN